MRKKQRPRKKHIPQRTCVGCRKVESKNSLIRIVRTENGIKHDHGEKLAGRGAYLHQRRFCGEQAMGGGIGTIIKSRIDFRRHRNFERIDRVISAKQRLRRIKSRSDNRNKI